MDDAAWRLVYLEAGVGKDGGEGGGYRFDNLFCLGAYQLHLIKSYTLCPIQDTVFMLIFLSSLQFMKSKKETSIW